MNPPGAERPFESLGASYSVDGSVDDVGSGVLWAINRYLFHPRGFALAVHYDDDGKATGWSIVGDGTECWSFPEHMDDDGFEAFERFLDEHRPGAPH